MHFVLGVAYGLGLYNLALELVGLEGFVYGTLDRLVLEHPIGGIQTALYFVFGLAGLQRFDQRGAELYLVEGFREGLAAVRIGDKFGYIDVSGELAGPPVFDYAGCFRNECNNCKI